MTAIASRGYLAIASLTDRATLDSHLHYWRGIDSPSKFSTLVPSCFQQDGVGCFQLAKNLDQRDPSRTPNTTDNGGICSGR
jgi:hypothetical protein